MPHNIDVVIPYVESSDKLWLKDYNNATGVFSVNPCRFRSWGTLKYLFRGISEYMPFVNRIILILSRESQLPDWVNQTNVKVVYHREFIPKEFLPTFNSCTIESFLYNISDISEQFIYFNDDFFPINPLSLDDFFTNGLPNLRFIFQDGYNHSALFMRQCRVSIDAITKGLNRDSYPVGKLLRPEHGPSPMLKSTLDTVGSICQNSIRQSISLLRAAININQYIYSYYQYFTNNYVDKFYTYEYHDLHHKFSDIKNTILNSDIQIVCLNDADNLKDPKQIKIDLHNLFIEKFPNKCKYEV